jgi:hypothetical protein
LGDNGHISDFCKSKPHADRGTEIHEMISLHIAGHNQINSQRYHALGTEYPAELNQWKEFVSDTEFIVLHNELPIYGHTSYHLGASEDDGDTPEWAGMLDLYGYFRKQGWNAVVDIKTGSSAPPHTALQTAAYAIGVDPMDYENTKRFSLRINGKGKYKLKEYQDPGDYRRWVEEVKRWQRNQSQQHQP